MHDPKLEENSSAVFDRMLPLMHDMSDHGIGAYRPLGLLDPAQEAAGHCFSISYSGPASRFCEELPLRFMGH